MKTESSSSSNGAHTSVYIETLGCAKNEVDTRDMKSRLISCGYQISDDPSRCDAIIVNTCSFIQPAIEESIDAIFELAGLVGEDGRGIPVIVAGCLPARFGEDLEGELTEAAAFIPCSKEDDIAEVVSACLGVAEIDPDGFDPFEGQPQDACDGASFDDAVPTERFAYVKISDGCDRFCSYCTIPLIRGRYHSFSYAQVLEEAQREVAKGAREIVLIGQDTGLWGSDLEEVDSLATLLTRLADALPDTWIRTMYTQPENVTDELLDAIASRPNIAPYLDIPIQHVVPRLLDDMNRLGSYEEFISLIDRARLRVPGIALRTTLIAGFPSETEADLERLIEFVEEAELDYVGVFPYSREEGTRAYELPSQLDDDEKAYRAERVRSVADAVSAAVISKREGTRYPVLVEGIEEDGQHFGRAIVQAPEVDGVTYIDGAPIGTVVDALVEDTLMYDMEAAI